MEHRDEIGPINGGKMAPLTFSLEWDCWHLGLWAIEYEETGKELDRGVPVIVI